LATTDQERISAIITAGGIGTRLLPFSKEIPKEMSPIITRDSKSDTILVKPIIQAIFEQLYDFGVRSFFTVVGRGKRAIEDHFTPDQEFIEYLKKSGKKTDVLSTFYEKAAKSHLAFVTQTEPRGFGDAVLRVKPYLTGLDFIVHAGDTFIISPENDYLSRLQATHTALDSDATVLLQEVKNPELYGVVIGEEFTGGIVKIDRAVEKPEIFLSQTAIMPIYIFKESIFEALESISPGKGGELQLTDAIQFLITSGKKVVGVKLNEKETRLDIGSPETLIEALWLSSRELTSREAKWVTA